MRSKSLTKNRAGVLCCFVRAGWSRALSVLLFAVLLGSWLIAVPATAEDAPIEAFYGTYEGKGFSTNNEDLAPRDISVSIKPEGRGFNVAWMTAETKDEGRVKQKNYSISFETTERPGIFGSAMQRNKFGDSVPLDPLKGQPYVWARINGQTLTVYGLIITRAGSYEMQVYHRTLSDKGLELEFYRYVEGEPVRAITGTLVKVNK